MGLLPDQVLSELKRALRPTGHMLFLEDTRKLADVPGVEIDLVVTSCRPDLQIMRRIRRAGFAVYRAEWFSLSGLLGIHRSMRRAAMSAQSPVG